MFLQYLGIILLIIGLSFIGLQGPKESKLEEFIEQHTNNYIFKENTSFTISGAIKIEEIGQMVEVEKLDENLNKTKVKEHELLMTDGRYGGQVYRVTFQDGTTKRYYWQFSRVGDGEWLPLDFGPYKN